MHNLGTCAWKTEAQCQILIFPASKHVWGVLLAAYWFLLNIDLRTFRFWDRHDYHLATLYVLTQFLCVRKVNLGYLYQWRIIDQDDTFRYFRILMSTCSDSVCENTFETLHVRFIHEDSSVLITTPLDQIQQNLLGKETCQTTAKSADLVLQTWFEEYPTPP